MEGLIILDAHQQAEKAACEQQIMAGIRTFHEVGAALSRIKENSLYRDEFSTFGEYCAAKWNFTRQRAYQLIEASDVAAAMSTVVDIPSERAARELAKLSPEDRIAAAAILKDSPITAATAREAVAQLTRLKSSPTRQHRRKSPARPKNAPSETFTRSEVAEVIGQWYAANRNALNTYPSAAPDVMARRIIALFN